MAHRGWSVEPWALAVEARPAYVRDVSELGGRDAESAERDGQVWEIGTDADSAWIAGSTTIGRTITSAIPRGFEAYATVVLPASAELRDAHEQEVIHLLVTSTPEQPWWLGYLDTGGDDVVFVDAPRVRLYSDWPYVLVKAGPAQAKQWRADVSFAMHCRLPDLMFPADRSWLISALWDDDWWCLGGPLHLVDAFAQSPTLETRIVDQHEDATPPGHATR